MRLCDSHFVPVLPRNPTTIKAPLIPWSSYLHLDIIDDMADPSQPALGPDGRLLDASEIKWYNDPDDTNPIQPQASEQPASCTCT
jgi:hypothetical protein